MVDLETIGKIERQGHLDTVMNTHDVADVLAVRMTTPKGRLLVRTNPLHQNSSVEIEALLDAGADKLMLPWFHGVEEVKEYARIVDGRAGIHLLAETRGAKEQLYDCCAVRGVERVHIGLNDLSLELGRLFMFELLIDGAVSEMAVDLRRAKMPFGIGGVARAGEGLLSADRILVEHARLGSDATILSRTFHRKGSSIEEIEAAMNFQAEVTKLREIYAAAKNMGATDYAENLQAMTSAINVIREQVTNRKPPGQ
jgi:2-keto-3-deoxy-L-rhamnonate aldolase RhmA